MFQYAVPRAIFRIPVFLLSIAFITMAWAGSSGFLFANSSRASASTSSEIEAELSGAPINGIVPKGEAEFEIEDSVNREFRVRVENVNLPAGTVLDVFIDGTKAGTITLIGGLQRSELELKTELGQQIPQVSTRTRVVVATQPGSTIVAGAFSNLPPSPSPAPTQSPTPNGDLRIEAKLAGAAINGL